MIKPDFVGPQALYFNPVLATPKFTTANIAAISTAVGAMDVISPYAYTATVSDEYDSSNFLLADAGAELDAAKRLAVGLFLTPDNDLGNLLFQVSGSVHINSEEDTNSDFAGRFFFGRKATNNTVVSDLTAPQNTLAKYTILPSVSSWLMNVTKYTHLNDSIQSQVFSLKVAAGYVYCFGYMLDNFGGNTPLCNGIISLAVRKYRTSIDCFRPEF